MKKSVKNAFTCEHDNFASIKEKITELRKVKSFETIFFDRNTRANGSFM